MTEDDLARYLARLGLEAEPPSAAALVRLQEAHVENIPYETTWIHLGERRGIDRRESVRAIVDSGRGGYCYQVNGALSLLLETLGYRVTLHRGGVHGPTGPSVDELGNHLVLLVHGLVCDESPDGRWYVDTGLGDAVHGSLPLRAGAYRQGPYEFALETGDPTTGDWHFRHDPNRSFAGMSFHESVVTMDVFAARHVELSTSPDSGFVRTMTAFLRDADGVDALRGLVLRREPDGGQGRTITDRADWFAALADVFGLRFDAVDEAARERMWRRVNDDHVRAGLA